MIKEITDFPGYFAGEDGQIFSKKMGKMTPLKPSVKKNGYAYVTLFKNGKRFYKRVHRLIAETFLNNPKNLPQVNHLNENKSDNRAENLEWCTPSQNLIYGTRRKKIAMKVSDPLKNRKNNTSGRKGVNLTKWGTWHAYMNGKGLGTFKTFREAVEAREKAEKESGVVKGHEDTNF